MDSLLDLPCRATIRPQHVRQAVSIDVAEPDAGVDERAIRGFLKEWRRGNLSGLVGAPLTRGLRANEIAAFGVRELGLGQTHAVPLLRKRCKVRAVGAKPLHGIDSRSTS